MSKRGRKRRARKSPEGPRIVDTRPEQEVERTATERTTKDGFELPSSELLEAAPPEVQRDDEERLRENAKQLEKTLAAQESQLVDLRSKVESCTQDLSAAAAAPTGETPPRG